MRTALFAVLAAGAVLANGPAFAEVVHFTAKLAGPSETPPTASKGMGVADVTLDTSAKQVSWKIVYHGLSGPVTMAHFHGPAAAGVAAGVTVGLKGKLDNPIEGSAPVGDAQIGDLRAGLWYLNLHTAKNPGGEIRGQVTAP